jgi:hypothetical protein
MSRVAFSPGFSSMDPKRRALRPIAAHTRYGDAGALPVNLPMKTHSIRRIFCASSEKKKKMRAAHYLFYGAFVKTVSCHEAVSGKALNAYRLAGDYSVNGKGIFYGFSAI